MKLFQSFVSIAPILVISLATPCQGSVILDFNVDGVLPTAQGFSAYGSMPGSGFTVSGGLLRQDTLSFGSGGSGFKWDGSFDLNLGFVLEIRMRIYPGTGEFGVDFEVSNTVLDFEFGFTDTGIVTPLPRQTIPFNTQAMNTYRIVHPGGGFERIRVVRERRSIARRSNHRAWGRSGQRFLLRRPCQRFQRPRGYRLHQLPDEHRNSRAGPGSPGSGLPRMAEGTPPPPSARSTRSGNLSSLLEDHWGGALKRRSSQAFRHRETPPHAHRLR